MQNKDTCSFPVVQAQYQVATTTFNFVVYIQCHDIYMSSNLLIRFVSNSQLWSEEISQGPITW